MPRNYFTISIRLFALKATSDFSERVWQRELKNNPNIVKKYALEIEQM